MANIKYLISTAYRDSRKDRGKLALFMSAIILGIAALVAINSFNYNLVKDIDEQSKSILGADMSVTGNQPIAEHLQIMLDSIPAEVAYETELFTMSYLPKTDDSQFIGVKSIDGNFPFYGKLLTEPDDAFERHRDEQFIIVDHGMMLQYGLEVGDTIKIGGVSMMIGGRLKSSFGSISAGSSFAPNIYITPELLDKSQLIQPGSLVDYAQHYKLPQEFDPDAWEDDHREAFRNESLRITTIDDQRENLKEAFDSLNYFLNLVALVSLILGCIGVASSVMIYIKNKVSSIAIFRCLGMTGGQSFFIYFIQILVLGIISVIIGAAIGSAIQMLLPIILQDFLPYKVDMDISWRAIMEGASIGVLITMLFALVPLVSIRNITPLRTLRASVDQETTGIDWLKIGIYIAIALSIFLFLYQLIGSTTEALVFSIGLLVAFLVLFGVSKLIVWGVRRYFPTRWSFVFRQGLANLYRPNNQTQTLIISIGLGAAILTTLFIIQGLLLENVGSMDAGNQPNMILFGIEKEQKDDIKALTEEYNMPVIQQVPIVTMRLAGWQGRTKTDWLADTSRTASRWAINREARVSFRDSLNADEQLVEGVFTPEVEQGDSVFISLADNYARSMDVSIGDEMVWNVQGALITSYVGSIRKIDFRSMQTRFFILFPNGVLERAPQFQVLVTKSPDTETTAQYRSAVVKAFPNVSVIDLGMILVTLNDILTKVSYIIQFMAGFSILTGLIVLISSLFLSKFQRIRESVLLRTIGALRHQIFRINFVEYLLIGSLSALTGIVLALIGSYFLATQQLELEYDIRWGPIFIVFVIIVSLTVIIGLLNSREVLNKSPLEVLRKEV